MPNESYHHGNLRQALILAGLEILTEKGIRGLSLRKVAKKVGVSHTAPYNHFPDKQALLAALSAEGLKQLFDTLISSFNSMKESSEDILLDVAYSYLQFALNNPDRFKLMFSGALDEESIHPDYLEISNKNIALLEEIVDYSREIGQFQALENKQSAMMLWSTVHGFTVLMLEDQFPPNYKQGKGLKELLKSILPN